MMKFFTGLGCSVAVLFGIFGLLLLVPVGAIIGYITGMILQMFVGVMLTHGLNVLFDTTRFVPETLPYICAVLGAFGGYFKSNLTVKNPNNQSISINK